ncbi:MAG: class I SAM-dependent methyltransferase [Leptolyngbyaceae cyanobacterium CSU_1_4]|nr:class I SAM-dependent methyltransferase [Leptolyngbyaceae cyanobacterium CSU_1_4]
MNRFRAFLAHQLGLPSGWFGRLLLQLLNRNNATMNDLVLQELLAWQELQGQYGDISQEQRQPILEIGFGGGDLIAKLVKALQSAHIVGVDRSPDAIALGQQRFQRFIRQGKVKLRLADAASLPFPSGTFHQICTVNTLYFWSDAPQVLLECHRSLIQGGKLVIGYASKTYLEQQKLSCHGFATYEVAEVETMMRTAGFTCIKTVVGTSDRPKFFCTSGVIRIWEIAGWMGSERVEG